MDPSDGGRVVELDLTIASNKEGGLTSSEAENEEGVAVVHPLPVSPRPIQWGSFNHLTLTPNLVVWNLSARASALSAG